MAVHLRESALVFLLAAGEEFLTAKRGDCVNLIEEILLGNRIYAKSRPWLPSQAAPAKHVAVVTCMDARIEPLAALGLAVGDAHVLRNAGARVTDDVVRSLAVSQQVLGTDVVFLMPHTQCGMIGLTPDMVRPRDPNALPMEWLAIDDISQSLESDLAHLRQSPWIGEGVRLVGLVFDVGGGNVRLVGER